LQSCFYQNAPREPPSLYKGVRISNLNNHNKKHLIKDKAYTLVGAERLYYSTASQEYLEPHQLVLQLATAGNEKIK